MLLCKEKIQRQWLTLNSFPPQFDKVPEADRVVCFKSPSSTQHRPSKFTDSKQQSCGHKVTSKKPNETHTARTHSCFFFFFGPRCCRRSSGAWRDLSTRSRNRSGTGENTEGKKTAEREGRNHLQLPVRGPKDLAPLQRLEREN